MSQHLGSLPVTAPGSSASQRERERQAGGRGGGGQAAGRPALALREEAGWQPLVHVVQLF